MRLTLLVVACGALLTQDLAQAAGVITAQALNATQFASYQTGKTVQDFESVTGVPGFNIQNFNNNANLPVDPTQTLASGNNLLATWGIATQDGFIVTSGGNFPGGIFNLSGSAAGFASSGTRVLAPLGIDQVSNTENTCFAPGCNGGMAFEFFFSKPVNTVGFFLGSNALIVGTQNLGISVNNPNSASPNIVRDFTDSTSYSAGNQASGFVVINSTATDITSVSLVYTAGGTGRDFIDDVTFSRGASAAVPEPSTFALASLALGAIALRWKTRKGRLAYEIACQSQTGGIGPNDQNR